VTAAVAGVASGWCCQLIRTPSYLTGTDSSCLSSTTRAPSTNSASPPAVLSRREQWAAAVRYYACA
jgi:hypothetical protein